MILTGNLMNKNLIKILFVSVLLLSNIMFAQYEYIEESNMGITEEMFSNVNIRDAKAVIEIWAKLIHDYTTNIKETNTNVYSSINDLINDLNRNQVDLVFMNTPQYFNSEKKLKITPYFGTKLNGEKYIDLVLLSNKKLMINSFNDLKGKKITIFGGRQKRLVEMWLDVLLLRNGCTNKENFFEEIEYEENASKNILSVFFEKNDVCVSLESSFDTMCELNPQIKKSLNVLYKIDGLVNDLYCIRNDIDSEMKKSIVEFAKQIDTKPKTEQVYKIFKIDGSYIFKEDNLQKTRSLWNEFKNLNGKLVKK